MAVVQTAYRAVLEHLQKRAFRDSDFVLRKPVRRGIVTARLLTRNPERPAPILPLVPKLLPAIVTNETGSAPETVEVLEPACYIARGGVAAEIVAPRLA